MTLNLYSIAYPVTSLGPGRRVALWVAGCPMRCKGCITPQLLDPEAGKAIPVHAVVTHLLRLKPALDGITITGGEPFAQPGPLAELLEVLAIHRPLWNVLVYSGFLVEDLRIRQNETAAFLDRIDVLIDGPYRQGVMSTHPLAGSGNQRVHYLSSRAMTIRPAIDSPPHDMVNLGVGPSRERLLIGVLSPHARARIHRQLRVDPIVSHKSR